VPSWWRQRRAARTTQGPSPAPATPTPTPLPTSTGDALVLNHPPRDGV
jgi:lipopolysaccharide assembly protein A